MNFRIHLSALLLDVYNCNEDGSGTSDSDSIRRQTRSSQCKEKRAQRNQKRQNVWLSAQNRPEQGRVAREAAENYRQNDRETVTEHISLGNVR